MVELSYIDIITRYQFIVPHKCLHWFRQSALKILFVKKIRKADVNFISQDVNAFTQGNALPTPGKG